MAYSNSILSFGKRSWSTKAWKRVVSNTAATVIAAMAESTPEGICVAGFCTSLAYLMVATTAPVIGKVHAHHANENLL